MGDGQRLSSNARRLDALQSVAGLLDRHEPPATLLGEALDAVARGLAAPVAAALLRPETTGGTTDLRCIRGPGAARASAHPDDGLLRWVIRSGMAVVSAHVEQDPAFRHLEAAPWHRGAVAAIPLTLERATAGALLVARDPGDGFHPEDTALLAASATLLVAVFRRSLLEARERQRIVDFVRSLSSALDARDPVTRGHSERVAYIAMAILGELERGRGEAFPPEMRHQILLASHLHDIGKIGIPDRVLFKTSKLDAEEYALVKEHPVLGARILESVEGFDDVVKGILLHHERLDGSGYPLGLPGDEIPLQAQIIGLADSFDAITAARPYHDEVPDATGIDTLRPLAGTKFRPDLMEALLAAHGTGILEGKKFAEESPGEAAAEPDAAGTRIASRLGAVSLPAMPQVVAEALEKLRDPRIANSEIVRVVARDQSIASEILRLVNSASYGFTRRIATLQQAVTVVGLVALQDLVIHVGVARIFREAAAGERAWIERLWDHSQRCARAARQIAAGVGDRPDEAFTAGLLHDIGRLAIIHSGAKEWGQVVRRHAGERRVSLEVEREAFGFDHCQAGHWLGGTWRLPAGLLTAIARHHDPPAGDELPGARLARLVALADVIAWRSTLSAEPDETETAANRPVADPLLLAEFRLDEERALRLEEALRSGPEPAGRQGERPALSSRS